MACLSKFFITFSLFVVIHSSIMSQVRNPDFFESRYDKAGQLIRKTVDSLDAFVELMKQDENLTEIQKAKINLIRSKIRILDDIISFSQPLEVVPSDTIFNQDALMKKAQNFIVQSRPDEGIPLIIKYLKDIDGQSDSAVYAKIYLAEAYREKREYIKGIDIIYEILRDQNLSVKNKAFAWNRLAALYNEMLPFEGNRPDSVIKYSRLCINLSIKHNLTEYLAASQNELGSVFLKQKQADSALYYISKAAQNFLQIKKYPQTINTYVNLSRAYAQMGQIQKSKEILLKALALGPIEKNRNLFKYVYYSLAERCIKLGEYQSAYEYLLVSYNLMSQFFNDRIQRQINEMSAKYDLHEKETKIKGRGAKKQDLPLTEELSDCNCPDFNKFVIDPYCIIQV